MKQCRVILASILSVCGTWFAMSAAYATEMATAVAVDHAEHLGEVEKAESGGIPQLDPTYYPSQLFWLVIFFVLMYLLMAHVALPRVRRVIEGRDDQVRRDLETAHRLRAESEDMRVLYGRALRDADEEGHTHINHLVNELKTKQEQDLQMMQARLAQKVADTEARLADETEAAMKAAPSIISTISTAILGQLKKA